MSLQPGQEFLASAAAEAAAALVGDPGKETDYVPAMPTVPVAGMVHRDKISGGRRLLFNAVVARSVGKSAIAAALGHCRGGVILLFKVRARQASEAGQDPG